MIVVDGRTDAEKLYELLAAGAEQTNLDFKSTLDLTQRGTANGLNLVKDCVAMGNLPDGGYIVVGVNNSGAPAHDQEPVEVARFDSADLRARIARYTEAQVHVVSQAHVVEGRDVVLIYIQPNPDGLPVPFSTVGQYYDGTRSQDIFAEGEVVIREGTANVRLRYSHWHSLLQRYREQIRAEAAREANGVVSQFVSSLREASMNVLPGAVTIPLVVGMDWGAFDEALMTHLETENTVRIQRFLRTAVAAVIDELPGSPEPDNDRYEQALDAIAAVAVNAAQYRRDDIYDLAVAALSDTYEAGGRAPTLNAGDIGSDPVSTAHWLAVINRVMAIGRSVVAGRQLKLLPGLVHRPVPVLAGHTYESWIFHGEVAAARRDMLPEHGGNLLSAVRQLLADRPWLRPDLLTSTEYTPGALDPGDQLLNQLAQFDLWWCVMAATRWAGRQNQVFYPSCAAFHQHRAQPAIDTIAADDNARTAAFPGQRSASIVVGLVSVIKLAVKESVMSGGWWDGIEPRTPAEEFINQYGLSSGGL